MLPCMTTSGGQALAFPDVCLVPAPPGPPIPTPLPNIAMLAQTDSSTCSQNVKIQSQPVITVESEVPRSMGDEAGTLFGVASGTQMDKVTFLAGSSKVRIEGASPVRFTDSSAHNGSSANAPSGNIIAPGQSKVFLGG